MNDQTALDIPQASTTKRTRRPRIAMLLAATLMALGALTAASSSAGASTTDTGQAWGTMSCGKNVVYVYPGSVSVNQGAVAWFSQLQVWSAGAWRAVVNTGAQAIDTTANKFSMLTASFNNTWFTGISRGSYYRVVNVLVKGNLSWSYVATDVLSHNSFCLD